SSDAAAPGATPARTGSARADTRTSRASTPPLGPTATARNLTSQGAPRTADEFANPTRSSWSGSDAEGVSRLAVHRRVEALLHLGADADRSDEVDHAQHDVGEAERVE